MFMRSCLDEQICEVECSLIRVSPFQPRRHFSEEDLEELVVSIQTVGLIHPPIVRPVLHKGTLLYYELIAGERRWRAMIRLGKERMTVIVRTTNDEKAAAATLIENVQRVDLNPMEMAHALKRLIEVFGFTQEEVADKVGKKRSTIANYLRLHALPEELQGSLSQGTITMGHAKAILSLSSEPLQKLLHERIVKNGMTVRDAERESSKLAKRGEAEPESAKEKDVHAQQLERLLQERLGTKVTVQHKSSGEGSIAIHYYNLTDLERLLVLLAPR